jgi:hypothetical protein
MTRPSPQATASTSTHSAPQGGSLRQSEALPVPFPIGETPGRPFIRPHRLAQLVPGGFTDHETIRDLRRRLNRPAWHVMLGRALGFAGIAIAWFCILYFAWQFAR